MLINAVRDHLNCLSKAEARASSLFNFCGHEMLEMEKACNRFHVRQERWMFKARHLYAYDAKRNVWTRGEWLFDLLQSDGKVWVATGSTDRPHIENIEEFTQIVAPIIANMVHERGGNL